MIPQKLDDIIDIVSGDKGGDLHLISTKNDLSTLLLGDFNEKLHILIDELKKSKSLDPQSFTQNISQQKKVMDTIHALYIITDEKIDHDNFIGRHRHHSFGSVLTPLYGKLQNIKGDVSIHTINDINRLIDDFDYKMSNLGLEESGNQITVGEFMNMAISEAKRRETDIYICSDGNIGDSMIAADETYLSIIIDELLENYRKYGEYGSIGLTLGSRGLYIFFSNVIKFKDLSDTSTERGVLLLQDICKHFGGELTSHIRENIKSEKKRYEACVKLPLK